MSCKPGKTIQRDCIFPFIVKYKGAACDTSIYYDPWFDKSPPEPSYYLSTYLGKASFTWRDARAFWGEAVRGIIVGDNL